MIRPAAVAATLVILALAGAIAMLVGTPTKPVTDAMPTPATHAGRATLPPSTDVTSTTWRPTTTLEAAPTALEVAGRGLEAWGSFATTADLDDVEPWFSPEGPQWDQFVVEASGGGVGPPRYAVTLSEEDVDVSGVEAVISGRVVFARTGEPSQVFQWTLRLVHEDGRWRIWTVEDFGS